MRSRLIAAALVASFISLPLVPVLAHAGDSEGEKTHDDGALVKIEIRLENGKIVKHTAEVRELGMDWNVEFDGEEHHHGFVFNIVKDGKKAKTKLAYSRDGEKIVAPFVSAFQTGKREVLRTDKGIAFAFTVTFKKFPRSDDAREKDRLEPDGGDDPLGDTPIK
jgi:hypothetical protein